MPLNLVDDVGILSGQKSSNKLNLVDDAKIFDTSISGTNKKSKDLIDIMAGGSPEESIKKGQWVSAGIQQTGKDLLTIPAHFFNQLLLNYPRYATEKAGFNYPEKAQSQLAQKTAQVSGIIGGVKNPILKTMGIPSTVGKTALQGAITGVLYAPEDTKTVKEDIEARTTQAISGTVLPISIKGVGKIISNIPKASKFMSGRIINSLIKPLGKDFSYGKNPGLGVANEGIIANNMDELASKISDKQIELGKNIKQVLTTSNNSLKKLNIKDSLNPIDKAMEQAASDNNQNLVNRLRDVKRAITQQLVLDKDELGQPIIKTLGDRNLTNLSPLEATQIKSSIGKMAKWTDNPSDDKLINKAIQNSYRTIKDKIGNAVPEVRGLNERYANILSAEVAVDHRNQILQRQNLVGLAPKIVGGSGAIAGLVTGNPGVIMASIATLGVDKIMSSPFAKTRLAVGLNKLSKVDINKIIGKYPKIKLLTNKLGSKIKYEIKSPYFSK